MIPDCPSEAAQSLWRALHPVTVPAFPMHEARTSHLDPASSLKYPACIAERNAAELRVLALQIAVIESNPEQSKHLETARMKLAGLELDLVNLRSEQYADQTSRIPTMEFGTPEQDALRCS